MSPLKPPSTASEWAQLARYRCLRVLNHRIAATIRQLEVKICEAGPSHIRPQPHILSRALKTLTADRIVRTLKPAGEAESSALFYTLAAHPRVLVDERIEQLLLPYRLHRMLADRKEYCSNVLENIVKVSFQHDSRYQFQGKFPTNRPLDAVFTFKPSGLSLGVEVKNVREWVYPGSEMIWPMLSKCLELDALPVLVARKVAFLSRRMFSTIGVLRLEFHQQAFAPQVGHLLESIRHTDQLGYKDVVALPPEPHPTVLAFATNVVPKYAEAFAERWAAHRQFVHEYANERGLARENLGAQQRQSAATDFLKAIGIQEG